MGTVMQKWQKFFNTDPNGFQFVSCGSFISNSNAVLYSAMSSLQPSIKFFLCFYKLSVVWQIFLHSRNKTLET